MSGLSNGRLGMMLLVGTETVLFSSFIGAYIVLRAAAAHWPPIGTPHLTLDLATMNTALLLASTFLAYRRRLGITLFLGVVFLLLQGAEFHRLYARGLTLQTGTYGALFYTLIACHGLHVLGGLGILSAALLKMHRLGSSPIFKHSGGNASKSDLTPAVQAEASAEAAEMYWHFVTAVWLVLFAVLYIV